MGKAVRATHFLNREFNGRVCAACADGGVPRGLYLLMVGAMYVGGSSNEPQY